MPFMIFTDPDHKVIYQKVRGVYNASQLTEANRFIHDVEQSWNYSFVFDFLEMRMLDLSEDCLLDIGRKIKHEVPVRLRALVVPPRFREIAESFVGFSSNAFRNVRAFDDLAGACDWLLLSEEDLVSKCSGYRPLNTVYDSESDHWNHMIPRTGPANISP